MPQDHPTDNPILNAAKRELVERAKATAPLCTANDAYNGPARIVSINTSAHKGTRKSPVADGRDTVIEQFGLASDAHAGHWHRQVSFLAAESIQTAQARGLDVREGDFGKNFTTQGINLLSLPLGTQLKLGSDVLVEISQIGKVCHTRCAIYHLLSRRRLYLSPRGHFWRGPKGRRGPYRRRYPGSQTRRRLLFVHPRRGPRRD